MRNTTTAEAASPGRPWLEGVSAASLEVYGYVIVDNEDRPVGRVWRDREGALDCLGDFNRDHRDDHAPYRLFELREVAR